MKITARLSPIQEVTNEVFELLVAYWAFKKQSEKLIGKNPGGLEALENILLVQTLYQDIVLRLCKIGDTGKDTWGLQQVVKHTKKHSPIQKVPADIDSMITDYEEAIKEIKANDRNSYMAHISKKKGNLFIQKDDFRRAIPLAVEICDKLNGNTVEYKISSEWAGVEINLRDQA